MFLPFQGKCTPAFCCLGKLHLDGNGAKGSASGSGNAAPITGRTGPAAAGDGNAAGWTLIGNPDQAPAKRSGSGRSFYCSGRKMEKFQSFWMIYVIKVDDATISRLARRRR